MGHIQGESRDQGSLFPEYLDDFIPADHPVRVIDAFVESLALGELGFERVEAAQTGRPGYDPSDMLKLYIYGYLHQLRTSRRLERECERNIEVLWLVNRVRPSFKTIADFRRLHGSSVVRVCRCFVQFCRAQGLYARQLVAIDGTKLQAVASRKRVMTPERVAKEQAKLESRIAAYLEALDAGDAEASAVSEADAGAVAAALAKLRERQAELEALAASLAASGAKQHVEGEPEARLMRSAQGPRVAYNGQIAVDAEHHLIVHAEVCNEGNDHRQLQPMAEAAREALECETLTVVADAGYANGEQAQGCTQGGITPMVPRPAVVNAANEEAFGREHFTYDADTDTYRCPAGQTLSRRRTSQTEHKADYWNASACASCSLKASCTRSRYRTVVRSFFEDDMEAMHQRAMSDPQWMRQRRCVVEHPFGTLKWLMGVPRFLVRGLKAVRGEFALSVLAYNLKRVMAILGVETLVARLQACRGLLSVPAG